MRMFRLTRSIFRQGRTSPWLVILIMSISGCLKAQDGTIRGLVKTSGSEPAAFVNVGMMGTTGGVQQEIAARGFAFNSNNTFKNGVRFNNAVMPEMSALERIEVMKGSSAILFGNVGAGGVINLVTKKPTFTDGGEIGMRF